MWQHRWASSLSPTYQLIIGEVDAYVAGNCFRKRDSRLVEADRYKERHREEQAKLTGRRGMGLFSINDFVIVEDLRLLPLPGG